MDEDATEHDEDCQKTLLEAAGKKLTQGSVKDKHESLQPKVMVAENYLWFKSLFIKLLLKNDLSAICFCDYSRIQWHTLPYDSVALLLYNQT